MAKILVKEVPRHQREKMLHNLSSVLVQLKDERLMAVLLKQLLTESEIIMLARRLEIGARLRRGESYMQIREALGVGLTTIRAVDRWLEQIKESVPTKRRQHRSRFSVRVSPVIDILGGNASDLLNVLDLLFSFFATSPKTEKTKHS